MLKMLVVKILDIYNKLLIVKIIPVKALIDLNIFYL